MLPVRFLLNNTHCLVRIRSLYTSESHQYHSNVKDNKEDCLAACADEACNAVAFQSSTGESRYFLVAEDATTVVDSDFTSFRVCEPGMSKRSVCLVCSAACAA